MTTISAKVIADSVSEAGHRLTTIRCRYPKWIHAEGRTHRQHRVGEDEFETWEPRTPSVMEDPNLSRNAASSRAIPVKKMIEAIRADPAVPLFWGSKQPGMQGGPEIDNKVALSVFQEVRLPTGYRGHHHQISHMSREQAWLRGMEQAIELAEAFDAAGYHKQIVNRLLEPFMHIDVLISATEWSNFFALRIHEEAEPHIRLLAERIKAAIDESTPRLLKVGEWHLPYVTEEESRTVLRLSVARCAHLSYETVEGEPLGIEHAERIYDKLLGQVPIHASPAEHQATPDKRLHGYWSDSGPWAHHEQHGNFVGWRQYRKMLPMECL